MARNLLQELIETFPQADPASEFHGEEINGCEAVNFISEFIPDVREHLDSEGNRESEALAVLKACWKFIENVTDEYPERTDKFFDLRERVRNVLSDRRHEPPTVAVILEGGLVQCIVSDRPNDIQSMNLMVLDYDTEGADEEELLQVPQKDGSISTATGRYVGFDYAEIGLAAVMDQLDTRGW
ncbi:hypothetical protein GURASL_04700 [Geotalea uraniireducens]|uniref:Uncharacterized protein n=1 Tax=Geotalea uraniireducens TaxID=351604 RepID=A0ABN6VTQ4_9BACT|nr:hypothetical protein [Geotalea uraniireducens]BDV41547.1 hypothetical protein GURASL_04700 [Geotalea uraniireducens]